MADTTVLNCFFGQPDPDRWLPFDRYPRRLARRLVRGVAPGSGLRMNWTNLKAGLDRIGQPYRLNAYRHVRRHPREPACVIGTPPVLGRLRGDNPIVFGPSIASHPCDDPDLPQRLPIARVLVPCEWVREMFAAHWGDLVRVWPVGIDTDTWRPAGGAPQVDALVYDKIRWERERLVPELLEPVLAALRHRGLSAQVLRYGQYQEHEYRTLLARCRFMVFLCEHETQGLACEAALSCDVPVLAWDRGGEWRDPNFHPHRVRFGPVTSVPYFDARCGVRFEGAADLDARLDEFLDHLRAGRFAPRQYITEHLSLERQAREYVAIVEEVKARAG